MKKIKRLEDIENEKLRLRVLQMEQEKKLQQSWSNLKSDLNPLQLIQKQWVNAKKENQDESLLTTITTRTTEYISRHFGEWAGNTLHQKLDKLTEALRERKN